MSATLAALITTLEPTWTVEIHEIRPALAQESTNAWNNAGTGARGPVRAELHARASRRLDRHQQGGDDQ